jgi:prophage regulatory protein
MVTKNDQQAKVITILRLPQVQERVGLKRSTIYNRISEGSFPKQVSLGGRAVGWSSDAIDSWIADRINDTRSESTEYGMNTKTFRKVETLTEVLQ